MNNAEARAVLKKELDPYREWPYAHLRDLIGRPKRMLEIDGTSGARYIIDIYAHWDAEANGDVRVIGCIDDGGWRAFLPLSESFIKAPDGSFVGESSN